MPNDLLNSIIARSITHGQNQRLAQQQRVDDALGQLMEVSKHVEGTKNAAFERDRAMAESRGQSAATLGEAPETSDNPVTQKSIDTGYMAGGAGKAKFDETNLVKQALEQMRGRAKLESTAMTQEGANARTAATLDQRGLEEEGRGGRFAAGQKQNQGQFNDTLKYKRDALRSQNNLRVKQGNALDAFGLPKMQLKVQDSIGRVMNNIMRIEGDATFGAYTKNLPGVQDKMNQLQSAAEAMRKLAAQLEKTPNDPAVKSEMLLIEESSNRTAAEIERLQKERTGQTLAPSEPDATDEDGVPQAAPTGDGDSIDDYEP